MVAGSFFAHRAPGGPDLVARLRRAGYLGPRTTVWVVGENLAWARATAATARGIVAAWMTSPAHRANILEPSFRDIGIGIVGGTPGDAGAGVTVTTDFGRAIRTPSPRRRSRPRRGIRHRRPAPRVARAGAAADRAGNAMSRRSRSDVMTSGSIRDAAGGRSTVA